MASLQEHRTYGMLFVAYTTRQQRGVATSVGEDIRTSAGLTVCQLSVVRDGVLSLSLFF